MDKRLRRIAPVTLALLVMGLSAGCSKKTVKPTVVETPPPPAAVQPVVTPPAAPKPEPILLKPDYPERYVVVKGDTLWDISNRFLRDPWRWPELWQNNPQIINPHLIYPGDVLTLVFVGGVPTFQLDRARPQADDLPKPKPADVYGTVKLQPQIRYEALERAIPTIPLEAIRPFLIRPRVIGAGELESAPYVFASPDEHLMLGAGHRAYVRGIEQSDIANYVIVREGEEYRDPKTNELLGIEALHLADARVLRFGDPSTLLLTSSKREVLVGDRLLPADAESYDQNFIPHAPNKEVQGQIISVVDGVSHIGQYQVVVLSVGRDAGMEAGHVLAVDQLGRQVHDRITNSMVTLPNERAGLVMVFRVFDRVSYALVMEATRSIYLGDTVLNP